MNKLFTAHRGGAAILALAAALFVGCAKSDSPTSPLTAPNNAADYSLFDPEAGFISVGVFTGSAGAYTYHTGVVGGGLWLGGPDVTINLATPATPANAEFHYVYFPVDASTWGPGATAQVTISETNMPATRVVDSIRVATNGVFQPTLFNVSSVTLQTGYNDVSFLKFYHSEGPPPPPPGKGCTPGYWKQSQHFDSWKPTGLSPSGLIGGVFSSSALYTLSGKKMSNYTLVDGLAFKGGPGTLGAAQILLRAAIAADLNARYSSLGYPWTAAQVVSATNSALSSANRVTMLTLAAQLDELNNLNCPLN